jgi:hypothetical protein
MLAFSVAGLHPKKAKWADTISPPGAAQLIVRRQAALRGHHRIALADPM